MIGRTPQVMDLRRLPFLPLVLGAYAVTRAVAFVILSTVAGHQVPTGMSGGDDKPLDYLGFMAMWDGQWYERIATGGYPHVLPRDDLGHVEQNPWAFYPMFPVLARGLMIVTGWSFNAAGSTLALLMGFGAAALMGVLLRDRIGRAATVAVVFAWGLFPASVTLQIAYTESLAMLVLLATLIAVDRQRWLAAAGFAVLTGLARPIAVPLGVVTLVAVVVRWRSRHDRPLARREPLVMLAALVGCGLAGLIWPGIAWFVTGERSAYTDTMASWRGPGEMTPFIPWAHRARDFYGAAGMPLLVVACLLIVVMVCGPWSRALGANLRAWTLAYPAYLLAVLDPFTSIFRYLIPMFPLLVPLLGAGWVSPRRRGFLALRLGLVAVLFVGGQWWWTEVLYQFTPPSDYPP